MREYNNIDEVTLTSFVDDQLDPANRKIVLKAMDESEDIRNKIYELRKAKDLMKLSYGNVEPPRKNLNFTKSLRNQCLARVAAGIATLAIGASAGITGYNYSINEGLINTQNLAELTQQQGERIIVHISESNPEHFERTLVYTENFLRKHKKNGKAQIEVVANAGGIDLLRADFPLNDEVARMMGEYDNLTFIACTNAVERLRAQGIEPQIIKDVSTDQAALTHIIERLQDGWTYMKADSEMLKI